MRFILLVCFVLMLQLDAFAWNDEYTHPTLSEKAAEMTFGSDFMKESVNGQETRDLIRKGSEKEDDYSFWDIANARSRNHFYAPNRQLMSETGWQKTVGMPTPLWAQDGNSQATKVGGDWSWKKVREHQYNYLIASSKTAEDSYLADLLKGLGYQMHLIQDMSQPNHVRDDTHIPDGFGWKWWVNGLETWAKNNDIQIIRKEILDKRNVDGSPVFPIPDVQVDLKVLFNNDPTKAPVARLFDTRQYAGLLTPSTSLAQGLAEYTNANFFSESTSFAAERYTPDNTLKYFPYPRKAETDLQEFIDSYMDPTPESDVDGNNYMSFVISKKDTTGEALNCLTAPSPNTLKYFKEFGGEGSMFYRSFRITETCFREYAEKLIPRAVGYSKAMLDYFFRGSLDVSVPTGFQPTNRHIQLNVKNSTPGELMDAGSIELMVVFQYYKKNSSSSSGKFVPSGQYGFKKYAHAGCTRSNPTCTIGTTDTLFDFDLNSDPIPLVKIDNSGSLLVGRDMSFIVVYRGKLGNEPDNVTFKEIHIDGIAGEFDLSPPARGVYASVSGDNTSSTFTDFALAARNSSTLPTSPGSAELLVIYRDAQSDPFQSQPVDSSTDIKYVSATINTPSGISTSTTTELPYSLVAGIPVKATDVYAYLIHTDNNSLVTYGFSDISEPTPVDVFNNADKICINKQWYTAGSPEAIALADSNGNGYPDLFDPYAHSIANIFAKESSNSNATPASVTNFTFQSPDLLTGGAFRRLGYILTDYSFKYSLTEEWIDVSPEVDPWESTGLDEINPGSAVKNQTDADGLYTYPAMFLMRGSKMWWGASYIYVNSEDEDAECGWNTLP